MEKIHEINFSTELFELTLEQSNALKTYLEHHDSILEAIGDVCLHHGGLQGPKGEWAPLNSVPQDELVKVLITGSYEVQPTYIQWLKGQLEHFQKMQEEDKYERYGEIDLLEEALDRFEEAREQGTLY